MPKKTPGKLNAPPAQAAFDRLPLVSFCKSVKRVFYRLHGLNSATGGPWPPVFFGHADRTRFDPGQGLGTLYLGGTLAGVLMELFDDRWGPLGDRSRRLTRTELGRWWVTLVATPAVTVFEASGPNLSKVGTDLQLLSGDHATARTWALRIMSHPAGVDGILYGSRHDDTQQNLALFNRAGLLPCLPDAALLPPAARHGPGPANAVGPLVCGPAILLRNHPELKAALQSLEVAVLP
jgi:hypothetical protein